MIEIHNKKNHYNSIILISMFLFIIFFISILFFGIPFFIGLPILLICILYVLSARYTTSFVINNNQIIIVYFRFFRKKKLLFDIDKISVSLDSKVSFRSPKFF